jgi:hypothetical protein
MLKVILISLLAVNLALSHSLTNIRPKITVDSPPPSLLSIKATWLNQDAAAFYANSIKMQFAGDGFGNITPLKNYNYANLYGWWTLLDILNPSSNLVPSLASYYYGSTQTPKLQLPFVVKYLINHASLDLGKNWWWLHQAMQIAYYGVESESLAAEVVEKIKLLPHNRGIPPFVYQHEAFFQRSQNKWLASCQTMANLLKAETLDKGEINYINEYVKAALARIPDNQKNTCAKLLDTGA